MEAVMMGYGEIGKGVSIALSGPHQIMISDPPQGYSFVSKVDVLLVAIPWTDDFILSVRNMQDLVQPKATIIFSTVPIGTCRKLGALHFPIEAKHPFILRDIQLNHKHYIGLSGDVNADTTAIQFLQQAGLKFLSLGKTEHTEFLKLRSTTLYGLNIAFGKYSKTIADEIDLDYSIVKEYDTAHNELTEERGTPEHKRYLIDAPDEEGIKGHCVLENCVILREQFPSPLIDEILSLGKHPETVNGDLLDNKAWLACEFLGKKRKVGEIAKQLKVNLGKVIDRLVKYEWI